MLQRVRLSLLVLELVSVATLLRSVAYDRWITVVISGLLIAGAVAAQRGRTWGVGLALATAAWFPVAFAIGIAPAWFCLVGLAGALPFLLMLRSFVRFDKGATALLTVLAATGGTAVALGWKAMAWPIIHLLPSLRPSGYAHHGIALALIAVALPMLIRRHQPEAASSAEGVRIRVGDRLRIGEDRDTSRADEEAEEGEGALLRRSAIQDAK